MASDVNGTELKVGDKVRALTAGSYVSAIVAGEVYEVTSLSDITDGGARISEWELFMYSSEIKLVETPKNLTPKLIESLDELKVGDIFRDKVGTIFIIEKLNLENTFPVETNLDIFNLEELVELGAYKVKVEPLEMVEVEEVKPKLYELVEGQDYVKLHKGDSVTLKGGNTFKVVQEDTSNFLMPYGLQFFDSWYWVRSEQFLPENIISIDGVNIHEEAPYEGWVAGAKVKCSNANLNSYEFGEVYALGYNMFGDFGVVTYNGTKSRAVYAEGIIDTFGRETEYVDGTAYKNFVLIKE